MAGQFGDLPVLTVYEGARPPLTPLDVSETLRRRPIAITQGKEPSRTRKE